jgi:hypothetical protein
VLASLGSEPAKRAKRVRRKVRKWLGMVGLPGLAAAQAGMAGADEALMEKGTECPHPRPLSRERARGEKQGGRWWLAARGGGSELGEGALEGDLAGVGEGLAADCIEEPGEIARG